MTTECQDHLMNQFQRPPLFKRELAQLVLEFLMEETWDNISLKAAEWAKVDGFSAESTAMIIECQDLPMMNQSQQRASNYSFKRELAQLALEFLMVETWDSISQKVAEWEKVVGSSVESMVMTTECQDHLMRSQKLQRANNESDCLQNWCFEFNNNHNKYYII